jgi:hypothetical protein
VIIAKRGLSEARTVTANRETFAKFCLSPLTNVFSYLTSSLNSRSSHLETDGRCPFNEPERSHELERNQFGLHGEHDQLGPAHMHGEKRYCP